MRSQDDNPDDPMAARQAMLDQLGGDPNAAPTGAGGTYDAGPGAWMSKQPVGGAAGTVESPAPSTPANPGPTAPAAPASAAPAADPSGIDALYAKYGVTDGGRGSGFADRAYWLEHPDQIANGRLAADLAGTGTDQPTGTPGSGPWQHSGQTATASVAPPPAGAPSAVAAPPVPSAANLSVTPDANTSSYNQNIRDILTGQIAGLSAPTTAESSDVAPALSAFNTQSQRDQTTARDALAERFYAAGEGGTALDSGGFNTAVQQGLEKSAGDRANFTGSTIYNAANSKRQQLQQMLQTATNAGLTDQAQQIQAKIAAIDAQLRQQGLSQQNSQFGKSLAQQQSQFGDTTGLSYAQLIAQQNRDALMAGLNG